MNSIATKDVYFRRELIVKQWFGSVGNDFFFVSVEPFFQRKRFNELAVAVIGIWRRSKSRICRDIVCQRWRVGYGLYLLLDGFPVLCSSDVLNCSIIGTNCVPKSSQWNHRSYRISEELVTKYLRASNSSLILCRSITRPDQQWQWQWQWENYLGLNRIIVPIVLSNLCGECGIRAGSRNTSPSLMITSFGFVFSTTLRHMSPLIIMKNWTRTAQGSVWNAFMSHFIPLRPLQCGNPCVDWDRPRKTPWAVCCA